MLTWWHELLELTFQKESSTFSTTYYILGSWEWLMVGIEGSRGKQEGLCTKERNLGGMGECCIMTLERSEE